MTRPTVQKHESIDLDAVLSELGSFGKFQCINFFLICLPIVFNAIFTLSYIFTAGVPNHRCVIPECESTNKSTNDWISFAIPQSVAKTPEQCTRYRAIIDDSCSPESFNHSDVISCHDLVFETPEKTIATEWNITCKENKWKLTLAGTINHVAQVFCLPITGYVSDHYGRRTALVIGVVMGGIFGILRSFSLNYYMFMAFEFMDPLFSAGCYSVAFILGMEYLQPHNRVLGGVIISCFYAVGAMLMGIIGYFFQDNWRYFLLVMYIPALLALSYVWLIPESLRWLNTKSRIKEMTKIIKRAAKMNKKDLSNKTLEVLERETENIDKQNEGKSGPAQEPESTPISVVFQSKKLLWRVANCSFCWLTNTFVYYGLSMNAVNLEGNKYFNFTFSNVIEIPAHLLSLLLVNKIGRRWSMCGSLVLAGLSCVATEFVSTEETQLRFVLYLIGKFSISISFTIIYVYTAEMFPTNLRNRLLGICSMFGRIGSISAPQTPLLATFYPSLPLFMFGGISMVAGVFSLSFPETLNAKLPDTIEEAIHMGEEHEPHKSVD